MKGFIDVSAGGTYDYHLALKTSKYFEVTVELAVPLC